MFGYALSGAPWGCVCEGCRVRRFYKDAEIDETPKTPETALQAVEWFKEQGWKFRGDELSDSHEAHKDGFCPSCEVRGIEEPRRDYGEEPRSTVGMDIEPTPAMVRNFITFYQATVEEPLDDWTAEGIEKILQFVRDWSWPFIDSQGYVWELDEGMLEEIRGEAYEDAINMGEVLAVLFDYPSNENDEVYRHFFADYLLQLAPDAIKQMQGGSWSEFVGVFQGCNIDLEAQLPYGEIAFRETLSDMCGAGFLKQFEGVGAIDF